jgi:hypothetical protein
MFPGFSYGKRSLYFCRRDNLGKTVPRRELGLILLLIAMASCFSLAQTQSATGIEGVVTIAPIHPGPIKKDMPGPVPFANGTFVVQNQAGIVIASFTTDAEGRFQVVVPPGHYTVSRKDRESEPGYFGPFDIDVIAGKMTTVEWRCDSGMR